MDSLHSFSVRSLDEISCDSVQDLVRMQDNYKMRMHENYKTVWVGALANFTESVVYLSRLLNRAFCFFSYNILLVSWVGRILELGMVRCLCFSFWPWFLSSNLLIQLWVDEGSEWKRVFCGFNI